MNVGDSGGGSRPACRATRDSQDVCPLLHSDRRGWCHLLAPLGCCFGASGRGGGRCRDRGPPGARFGRGFGDIDRLSRHLSCGSPLGRPAGAGADHGGPDRSGQQRDAQGRLRCKTTTALKCYDWCAMWVPCFFVLRGVERPRFQTDLRARSARVQAEARPRRTTPRSFRTRRVSSAPPRTSSVGAAVRWVRWVRCPGADVVRGRC